MRKIYLKESQLRKIYLMELNEEESAETSSTSADGSQETNGTNTTEEDNGTKVTVDKKNNKVNVQPADGTTLTRGEVSDEVTKNASQNGLQLTNNTLISVGKQDGVTIPTNQPYAANPKPFQTDMYNSIVNNGGKEDINQGFLGLRGLNGNGQTQGQTNMLGEGISISKKQIENIRKQKFLKEHIITTKKNLFNII